MWKDWDLRSRNSFVDISQMAHCRSCCAAMYGIYDQRLRDYCYECLMYSAIDQATRIIKPQKVKK